MKNKPLYELNLPPAAFFIGQYVRVITSMVERDEHGETSGQISVVGLVVESDNVYLTLGEFSELEGAPIAHLAIKHDDIQMIRLQDPSLEEDQPLQEPSNKLN